MNKLILTFDIYNGVDKQEAFNHGIKLAQAAMLANKEDDLVNPFVGIEVKLDERKSAAVEIDTRPVEKRISVKGKKSYPMFPRS